MSKKVFTPVVLSGGWLAITIGRSELVA